MAKSRKQNKGKKTSKPILEQPALTEIQSSFWQKKQLHLMLVFMLGFMLYANGILNNYAVDDAIIISNNSFTQQGIAGIPDLLSKDSFYGYFGEGKSQLVEGGRYRPLSLVTFAIEMQLFGRDEIDPTGKAIVAGNPQISHAVNALIYGAIGIALYLFLMICFSPPRSNLSDVKGFIILGTTVLFLCHPIHTEAVANIKGRDELMVLLGSLLATYYAMKSYYFRQQQGRFILLGLMWYAFALFSKENAITFMAVIPIALWTFTKADIGIVIRKSAPFWLTGILFVALRFLVLSGSNDLAVVQQDVLNNPFLELTNEQRLSVILYSWGKYIQLLVVPFPLTHDYYPYHFPVMKFSDPLVLISLLGHVLALAYGLMNIRKRDKISFAILYYFVTFSVVSNLFFPIGTNMGERFIFMPSVGFCVLAILILDKLRPKLSSEKAKALQTMSLLLGGVCALFAFKTITRNFDWKDNYTLSIADVKHSPNSVKLLGSVAVQLAGKAMKEQDPKIRETKFAEAKIYAERSFKNYGVERISANKNLMFGVMYYNLKEYEQAIYHFESLRQKKPNHEDVKGNLSVAYRDYGRELGRTGNCEAANGWLNKAVAINPKDFQTFEVGICAASNGQIDLAVNYFNKAIELVPEAARLHYNVGMMYWQNNRRDEAIPYFQKAQGLDASLIPPQE